MLGKKKNYSKDSYKRIVCNFGVSDGSLKSHQQSLVIFSPFIKDLFQTLQSTIKGIRLILFLRGL